MIASKPGPLRWTQSVATHRDGALAIAAAAVIAILVLALGGRADGASQACTTNSQQGTLCVSVSDTPDPVAYSAFDGNSTFLSYHVLVTNQSRSSSLSHVGLTDTLPDGTGFVSATPSRGTCSASGQIVTCPIGALKKGQGASIDIVVTAPQTAATAPGDLTITNSAAVAFDERFNDQVNGGKQDTATATETTLVSKTAGQTFVPKGHSGKVDTDPAQDQYANVSIPNASTDVLATISLLPPDAFCVDGTVRISGKNYICRDGGFVDASVVDSSSGAPYRNTDQKLVFHLRWAPGLVSSRQTARNFAVFYQASSTAGIQVFENRCNAAASNSPCLRNITQGSDGGWSLDLVKDDNGHMR